MGGTLLVVIKTLASLFSMATNLSPSLEIYRIYKQKACGEVQVLPLVSLWGACHLWMLYGFLSGSIFPIFATFLTGSVLAVSYLSVYFWFTRERRRVLQHIAAVASANALTLFFAFSGCEFLGVTYLSKAETGDWIGYIAAATSLLLYASPFATLARVLKSRSVASIPIALVLAGVLNSACWTIYGLLESDAIVAVPNAVCVVFGCVQTAVYCHVTFQNKRSARVSGGGGTMDKDKRDVSSCSSIDTDRSDAAGGDTVVVVVASDDAVSDDHAFVAVMSPRRQQQ